MDETNTCLHPNCDEPRSAAAEESGLRICERHQATWDAGANQLEWEAAREILEPMIKTAEAIGNNSRVKVLEEAVDKTIVEAIFWETGSERLQGL